MCGKLFVLLLLLLPLLLLGAEQQYLITESQMLNIEKSLEKLEQDRQSWQQQAHSSHQRLKESDQRLEASDQRLEALEKLAETLNRQLAEERIRYRILEQSFSRYENSHTKERNEMAAKIIRLETSNKLKDKLLIGAGIVLFLIIGIPIIFRRLKG